MDFNGSFSYSETKSVFVENLKDLRIYPNPASEYVYISNIDFEENRFMLTDPSGKVYNSYVEVDAIEESVVKIELPQLPSGVYFIFTNSTIRRFTKM